MDWIRKKYHEYQNGIIFTLIFHILVFVALNISQFRSKKEYHENEMIIDFPDIPLQQEQSNNEAKNDESVNVTKRTNIASNRAANNLNKVFDDNYQRELEKAQDLLKDVSKQLSKEIPTIDDLQMPVKKNNILNTDSIKDKLYSGDSNVEYFLKDRYHIELPIPVYLSQHAGTIRVNIVVDKDGNVVSTNIPQGQTTNDQMLSFAKTAAVRTIFNPTTKTESLQQGYILYHFIAQ